jgi:hypothetical protein
MEEKKKGRMQEMVDDQIANQTAKPLKKGKQKNHHSRTVELVLVMLMLLL